MKKDIKYLLMANFLDLIYKKISAKRLFTKNKSLNSIFLIVII